MKAIRITLAIAFVGVVGTIGITLLWNYIYPYGRRPCEMACVSGGMLAYALNHDGWYPRSEHGPYAALNLLYPTNCNAQILAGVTGDISLLRRSLDQGKEMNESLTSWRYVQGFRTDDPPEIAILWESKAGFYADGRRNHFGGHAVLFLGGDKKDISESDWDGFLKEQELLRKATLAKRSQASNSGRSSVN